MLCPERRRPLPTKMTTATGTTTPCNWQHIQYRSKLLNSYSSASSSDGSSSTAIPASSSSSGSSSRSSSSPKSAKPLAALPETLWTGGTFSFPPCSSRTIQSLPRPTQNLKPPTIPTEYSIPPVAGFDDFARLFTIPEGTVACTKVPPAGAPTSLTQKKTTHNQIRRTHRTVRKTPPNAPISSPPTYFSYSQKAAISSTRLV
ncbi:hypothetical protein BDV93DRAFT_179392 [Ceratobasidium sp. AG-I]|nr:hypothetical protein BDV93DRAFT_179392 [Ceratobasidium sp. AG-I]